MLSDCIDHGFNGNKPQGYHQLRAKGRLRYVHRLAYAEHHNLEEGELPALIRHLCNNPRCVNPEHLKAGTHQDNANDRVAAGRSAKNLLGKRKFGAETDAEIARRFKLHQDNSVAQMAREYNVKPYNIYQSLIRSGYAQK